jgi:sporulation protein YlmC with PRC-barrel domain
MTPDYFDLAGQVLDHPIVDVNDYPCGKVDDIEIEGNVGEALRVKAILVGPGAWVPRLPDLVRPVARKIFGNEIISVPWEQVEQITPKVKLRLAAEALGLGKADRKANKLMTRLLRS